ncbi:hypothetical protein D6783_02050 [Candidatus Woesearchaeota archaeon]|nr:MAG: hypothetical protein D6783_02050 [Candidatus Woesearchaeota archaeon]
MQQKKQHTTIHQNKLAYAAVAFLAIVIATLPIAKAELELRDIQFDPAIIASGDEVDVVIQYAETSIGVSDDRLANPAFTFKVLLQPFDSITRKYVTIQDAEGQFLYGSTVFNGATYVRKFRVKVKPDAPAGTYKFRLVGQWYKNGEPIESPRFSIFSMTVKKEGIIIGVADLQTEPSEVRPGDNYVKVTTQIENSGEKDAKNVAVTLISPEGIDPSYANNNRVWIGRLNAGASTQATFYLDVDEDYAPGAVNLTFHFTYQDTDDNRYETERTLPFLIKERPNIVVTESTGEGLAGREGELRVTIKNTGTERAEAVEVRIIKQSTQPFDLDVRSDYVGDLEPGEEATAIFPIMIRSDAQVRKHEFKLLIRAKGDSDEGDDNIYTFARSATFTVSGKAPNTLLKIGIAALIIVLALLGWRVATRRKRH